MYWTIATEFITFFLGVLSMVADLYANAGVPDIQVCPVSISYERVLEEPLHAYELLGIPKPKESLRVRLFSAFMNDCMNR